MKLIQTQTLGSSSSTISFSEIPQTFTDLLVVSSIRASDTGPWASIQFNGSTANFTRRALEGTGSSVSSTSRTDGLNAVVQNPSDSTSNTFSNSSIYIPNYTGSTAKSVSIDTVSENNGTSVVQAITAFLWNNTAAITSMTITAQVGNLVSGSTISLYGIGSDTRSASAKATGGTIFRSGDYWVHAFTSSGTFTPTQALSDVEYLVIAGGGGGGLYTGNGGSGGGGAGGYRSSVTGESSGGGGSAESKLSLSSGVGYTVTIGAGGAGRSSTSGKGTNGSDTSFHTITSLGGGGGNGQFNSASLDGGSGGGGMYEVAGYAGISGGAGFANQGYAGGSGVSTGRQGGGGGGAGQTGRDGNVSTGAGGAGVSSAITGSSVTRGGGGGSSSNSSGLAGAGGAGGGGDGRYNTTGISGTANTGGGGGAGSGGSPAAGAGGSGIVIVRYAA